ncbi:peptidoglycan D,D-transpeptidase FtsI family protein [Georgenia sp. Z1491]|uniref:peptidoglycan D,D-transpeptidase FtsI family protein n=1 Tax=Georgenia sp. Z1491 TaxID=3416707 RepID=UPI003CEA7492
MARSPLVSTDPRDWMRRTRLLLVVLLAILLVVAGRLIWVQALEGPQLASDARDNRTRTYAIQAQRGEILDANGEVLATSVQTYNLGVNQQLITSYEARDEDGEVVGTGISAAAERIAPILDVDPAELGALMVGDSTFAYIARDISPAQWRQIRELGIIGIEPEAAVDRLYPNGNTGGNVVGFVGRDGVGLAGLELSYEEVLSGTDGSTTVEIGRDGQVIPGATREDVPAVQGRDVQTTIDRNLQYECQRIIDEAVERHGAAWGAVVVEEIGTGRILALCDNNTVDPGNYQDSAPEDRGSRAVTTPYMPGSTGKIPTFAMALDAGGVEVDDEWLTPDRITMPNGQEFRDNDSHDPVTLTTAGVLARSYNTGLVQIGDTVPIDVRYDYLQRFGLGQRTGIELPGESSGILAPYESWDERQNYTSMFGQGLALTLLQSTSTAATIGNGGVRMDPHVVEAVEEVDGTMTPTPLLDGQRVVSEESAADTLAMMEGAVSEEGTAQLAAVEGYRVAGKTGTAQVPDENGPLSGRVGTFIGVIPADAPEVAIGVVMYNADGASYGSRVAAPVFSDVAEVAMSHLGVPPSTEPAPYLPLEPGVEWGPQ